MNQPRLYEWYPLEQAVSFFGSPRDAESMCGGQWLIFPKTAVCLAAVGCAPGLSYFETGGHFCWVADRPYSIGSGEGARFLPPLVIGPGGEIRSIQLFVRPAEARDFLYAGELAPSHVQQLPGGKRHGMARFELKTALPSQIWLQLGGIQLGNLDFAPVDQALERLRSPATVEDRLAALRQLAEYWHGPIRPEDGMSEAELKGVAMPAPLRWWYRWAGNRTEIMSGQNILFKPRDEKHKRWQLAVAQDGHLLFYEENQCVYQWSTLPDGDDPPVFGRYDIAGPWQPEAITLSEHLILVCLFEAVWHAKYGAAAASLDERTLAEIVRHIPPVPIGPWPWYDARFHAGRGAFMVTMGSSVWIGAKTEHPLQFLKPYIDDSWDYVAL